MKHYVSLTLVILCFTAVPGPVLGHGGGLIDLNPCRQISDRPDPLTVHLDLFQKGNGPFCHRLPSAGEAQLVVEIKEGRRDRTTDVTVQRRNDTSGSAVFDPDPRVYRGGILSELVTFPEPGTYEVLVNQPDVDEALRFQVYVGVSPPLGLRVKSAVLNVLENTYVLVFLLFAGLGLGVYAFRRRSS